MRAKRFEVLAALGAVLAAAGSVRAGYTTVQISPEPIHTTILNGIYGGTFVASGAPLPNGYSTQFTNGVTTVTRVDDFGIGGFLNMLTGSPGSADDRIWTDGVATCTAEARFAGNPQEFGYAFFPPAYIKLFDVTGSGFAVTGSAVVSFGMGAQWQWARANDSDSGLVNAHFSNPPNNLDGGDHMVTYYVTGAPGVDPMKVVWLLWWEDITGGGSDRDYNDLVVQLEVQQCLDNAGCDDGNACTVDTCGVNGFCLYTPDDGLCDDGNECTANVCDAMLGCQYPNLPMGTACGNQTPEGPCDQADICDGNGMCVPNYQPSSFECRTSAGVCDVAEFCTGMSADCPPDGFEPGTTECRASAGVCDVAEFCTGSSADCPADGFEPSSTECRASAGICDVAEFCTGNSANCPPDGFEPGTTECRAAAGVCDIAEFCTGSSANCPPDVLEPNTTECRASAGVCDVAEFCTGNSVDCPPDAVQPNTVECRASAGICDVEEYCDGLTVDCPPDGFEPASVECRASEGDCDPAEFCTGAGPDCPPDALEPNTTLCRAAVNECDVDEFCTGSDVDCPADGFQPPGTLCNDDGDECTDDTCDGSGTCLHPESGLCGACCLASKDCIDRVLPSTCTAQGGTSSGAGSTCLGDTDGDGVDDLCDNCPGVDDLIFGVDVCVGTGVPCASDADCGPGGTCAPACSGAIPTVSQWGLVVLALTLLVGGKLYFGRRQPATVRA